MTDQVTSSTAPIASVRVRRASGWLPPAIVMAGLAALVVVALFDALAVANDRLPGIDAGVHYAWEVYTRSALATGHLPHWNPYVFMGMPHFANTQMNVLYPPAVLLRWVPAAASMSWMVALHLWIAGVGALWLSRVIGLRWLPAAAVGVAVMFGGSVVLWLHFGHLLVIYCTAWMPWALAGSILSARRRSYVPHAALPVLLALQFLAGYAQGSLYIAAMVALYFLYCVVWPEQPVTGAARLRPLVQLSVVGALALGLSAFQFLPFVKLAAEAGRTTGISYEAAIEGQWGFRDLATIFFPFQHAQDRPIYRHVTDPAYVGWLFACAMPFAFVERATRRIAVFLVLLSALAVAFALGSNLPFYRLQYLLFPGLRLPGRFLFLATLGLAVLGGLGLQQFALLAHARRWRLLAGGLVVTALAAASAAAAIEWQPRLAAVPVHASAWLPLAALVALAAVAAISVRKGPRMALCAGLLVVAVDMTALAAGGVETVPYESSATLSRWLGQPQAGRAFSLCENRVGDVGLQAHQQPAVAGPGSLYLRDYAEWLDLLGTARLRSDAIGRAAIRRDLLNAANVAVIISCEPLDSAAMTLVSSVDSISVYRNDQAWPRAIWTCGFEEATRSHIARQLLAGRYESVGRLTHRAVISVRWATDLDEHRRLALEERYRLARGVRREGATWGYVLEDSSPENVAALLRDHAVDDIDGLNRALGTVSEAATAEEDANDARREALVGTTPCDGSGGVDVIVRDRPDGLVVAEVSAETAGVVLFSEPFYEERHAFVDGSRVRALEANLAFTAVPVPAGSHRVELRFVPRSFHLGLGVSALTAVMWAWLGLKA
jgi:hypothetical protein